MAKVEFEEVQASQTVQTQNVFDLTIAGNTAGAGQLVSSGTLTLVAGNNITLSQAGANAITIIGGAGGTGGGGSFSAGVSSAGNTLGTTGTVSGQLIFVGGNQITLSESSNLGSATITISGPTMPMAVIAAGNTSGTTASISSGTALLAGGNNITLSQNANSITISAFTQTVQTQNLIDITLAGNTTGTLSLVSSGTLTLAGGSNITLSQNGNAVTIAGPSGLSAGLSSIGNTSGTTGMVSNQLVLVGGNMITLSESLNLGSATITI